ncbi:hypothetical protein AA12717_1822 [Gluconacetobacter sacchari DSM 12717]|uniref:Uncharacterized protein n=1 Tax=Gluconacetobacter sacchari DSM 12717 TaxID=1307940 RepID=A0ABQ0P6R5_9PROT|nr:hypothetical protein AA12717_1822 [Gluconacetobacter sacchari DSM 12717]
MPVGGIPLKTDMTNFTMCLMVEVPDVRVDSRAMGGLEDGRVFLDRPGAASMKGAMVPLSED